MSEYAESVLATVANLRAPIAEGTPGGSDISFDPSFEQVKAEIDKLSDMGGATPDWKKVNTLAAELLAGKSKDFRAAIWLATARLELSGWAGWAEGLAVVHALATDYWDTMFPEARRARARANLFGWMLERVKPKVESLSIRLSDGDAVRYCDSLVSEIDSILADKVGDAWGGLGDMTMVMRSRVRDIPEPPPPPPPPPEPGAVVETPAATTTTTTTAEAGAMPTITSAEGADDALFQLGQAIVNVAAVLREADFNDPHAYRLLRVGAGLGVRQLPTVSEGTTTMIPSPDTAILGMFEMFIGQEAWAAVSFQAENAIGANPFWLDMHRWSARALERLGAEEARAALGRELVAFLSRLPGIETFSFSDGMPFADAETLAFLEEERARYGSGGGGAVAKRDPLDAAMAKAQERVAAGEVAAALAAVTPLVDDVGNPRRRFELRTRIATLTVTGGRPDIGRAMLESLLQEADRHQLQTWAPNLCVPILRDLVQCYTQLGIGMPDERGPGRRAELFDRLCQIDPGAAASLVLG
jgi:type VI secretion system protein VasJ